MSLKSAREQAGLSQNQLAKQADVSAQTIRNIEQGVREAGGVSSATIAALAQVLAVPEWVIRQTDDEPVFEFFDGYLVVDEIAYKTGNSEVYIRIGEAWYCMKYAHLGIYVPEPYQGSIAVLRRRANRNHGDYLAQGLVPRGGYQR